MEENKRRERRGRRGIDSLQPSRRLTRTIFREGIALSSSAGARINTWRARAAAPLKRAPLKRHEREREREASVRVAVTDKTSMHIAPSRLLASI